jgi:hypothetical protein
MIVGRRPLLLSLGCAALVGCKRKRAPVTAEVWDEEPAVARAEAIGALAPPWPSPSRGQLDDGLITFWLHEPGSATMRIRLLVPTTTTDESPPGEAVAVAAEHVRFEWQRRVQRLGVAIAVEHGAHRFELVAVGSDERLAATLAALRSVLASQTPTTIEGARERITDQVAAPGNLESAASATLRRLIGVEDVVDTAKLRGLSRAELHEHWQTLADPQQAVLLVHSGTPAEAAKGDLRKLSESWRGAERRGNKRLDQATARLRRHGAPKSTGTRLLAQPPTPIVIAKSGKGTPMLVLGRTIPLEHARDRALARLAQRVAQEEMDASIAITGNVAVFMVAAKLGKSAVDRDLQRTVDELAAFARTRHPRQRLFQAVQLWLGARVVESSLAGEDWTDLFSSAIDLADTDAAIAGSLASDAKHQLDVGPDELEAWTRKWLDPRQGEPGWAWATAGLPDDGKKRIEKLTPIA